MAGHWNRDTFEMFRSDSMKKTLIASVVMASTLPCLGLVAGRSPVELASYIQASADHAVETVEDSLPDEVLDGKLDKEIRRVEQDLIDRRVQLGLAKKELKDQQESVRLLKEAIKERASLFADQCVGFVRRAAAMTQTLSSRTIEHQTTSG